MGTWGSGPFENDDAMDWVLDLLDAKAEGTGFLREYLSKIVDEPKDEYLEAPDCAVAIAAAEAVAAMRGQGPADPPEALTEWLAGASAPEGSLVSLAGAAVDRVMKESELVDLWTEAGDQELEAWRAQCASLKRRLTA